MRVGISGTFWVEATTGSGQHLRGLLKALAASEAPPDITLYIPKYTLRGGNPQRAPVRSRFISTPFDGHNLHLAKLWYEQIALPAAADRDEQDVLHVPYLGAPLLHRVPVVVTAHDMIPYLLPEYRSTVSVRVYMRLAAWSARRAQQVIAVSSSAAHDALRVLKLDSRRLHVVYNAVPDTLAPASLQERASAAARIGLPARYFVYLGGFDRRKNVPELLQAFRQVQQTLPERLVIAGRLPESDTTFKPDPRRLARELHLTESVVFIGEVSEADKPALYGGATALVFPSIYEGFGLPPLESMACGTPVIVCRCSSLEEVAGTGALYTPPGDVNALADAMLRIAMDARLREELARMGLEQSRRFSWEISARKTLAVYQQALHSGVSG